MAKTETLCVQGGWQPKNGEPRVLPIYQSTTFKYETTNDMADLFDLKASGYFYTRLQNPTNDAVASKIAALEGGVAAMLTSSGQAANFYAVFNICESGDHFISTSAIYGGTSNLFSVTMKKLGIECTFVDQDASDEEIEKAFRPNTKCFFGETVANPAGKVLDLKRFADIAHKHGVPMIVDNTFPTPILCRPFDFGVDIVTHSTTKYMTAMLLPSAAASSIAATSTGKQTTTVSRALPNRIRAITALPTRRLSARALSSRRRLPSSCVTSVPSSLRRMRSS